MDLARPFAGDGIAESKRTEGGKLADASVIFCVMVSISATGAESLSLSATNPSRKPAQPSHFPLARPCSGAPYPHGPRVGRLGKPRYQCELVVRTCAEDCCDTSNLISGEACVA
jgi:hypothetical protein